MITMSCKDRSCYLQHLFIVFWHLIPSSDIFAFKKGWGFHPIHNRTIDELRVALWILSGGDTAIDWLDVPHITEWNEPIDEQTKSIVSMRSRT